jgi:peptidoglycan/xylan/chitin deacetylase (PgdA/CDA1 family)
VRQYAYHDLGNRVGVWRLVEVLDRYEVPCTVSLNVAVLDHYPEIAAVLADRQWDLMSHGLYNTRYLTGLDREAERQFYEACNRVLERHTGHRFAGMLGPNITGNAWTPDERPSPLLTSNGARMVALPYTYELNDAPLLMRSHVEGEGYARRCLAQFDRLYADSEHGGRLMCLVVHPFAIGQPHRIAHFDRVLAHLRSHDDVWIATASDIVDHYLEHHYDDDLAGSSRA